MGIGGGSNTSLATSRPEESLFLPVSALLHGLGGEMTLVWCLTMGVMLTGFTASGERGNSTGG